MQQYTTPARSWDAVGIDLLKLLRSTSGQQYLFICVDHFSRYVVLAPLQDKSAASVAGALVEHVINPFTTSRVIISDIDYTILDWTLATIAVRRYYM